MNHEPAESGLQRSRRHRVLWGVAGGLGEYLDIDPLLIRLGFLVLSLAGGFGLLAYLILAIALPEESPQAAQDRGERITPERRVGSRQAVALILIGAGLLFLTENLGWQAWSGWGLACPVVLIVLGLIVVSRRDAGRPLNGSR